jgi:PKD repeat protein
LVDARVGIASAPSLDEDLNGIFIGTLVITEPLYLPATEFVIQLIDDAGELSGYITPTLTIPVVPGSEHGPTLTGSWSGGSFTLSSVPFTDTLGSGLDITRTIELTSGVISTTEDTRSLSGMYLETIAGLTEEPLEMQGVFRLERPLRSLESIFGASPRTVYVGDNVFFTDLSLGSPISWSWDFGDGDTAVEQNPIHPYTAPGDYDVSLTVYDSNGSHTLTIPEFISVLSVTVPQADFIASPLNGPAPLEVDFMDHSIGGVDTWLWDFGDTFTSTLQNPTHTYEAPGLYTVSLTVSNTLGEDTLIQEDYITVSEAEYKVYLPLVMK